MIATTLKISTRSLHRRAEQVVDVFDRSRSPSGYARLLGRLYGFHAPFESSLARHHGNDLLGLDLTARSKLGLLRVDLRHCGWRAQQIERVARCGFLPALATIPQALGAMYVLEGATLGGRIIGRHLEQQLGLTSHNGAGFFASYGDRIDAMWQTFMSTTDLHARTPAVQDVVVASACATFEAFIRWFKEEHRDGDE